MQNHPRKLCHTTGWNKNMKSKLKSDFICLSSLGWQKDDSSNGMTVALFLGHNHKPSFHLLLWTSNGSLFPLRPILVDPCTRQIGFVSGHLSEDGHKFCCNLPQIFGRYVIMYYMMCLECCKHHRIYELITYLTHILHIFTYPCYFHTEICGTDFRGQSIIEYMNS